MGYRHLAIVIAIAMIAVSLTTAATDVGPMAETDGPEMGQNNTPTTAFIGQPMEFNITITDETGVQNASVEWWHVSGKHTSLDLSMTSGNSTDGTWAAIHTPLGSIANIDYKFWAVDTLGNSNYTSQFMTIRLTDINAPSLDDFTAQLSGNPTTGDSYSFFANVSDDSTISQVKIHYSIGSPPWLDSNVSMTPMSTDSRGNGLYVLNLTTPTNSTESFHYTLWARDAAGNIAVVRGQVSIRDNDRPEFLGEKTDKAGTTGDEFHFEVEVSDNVKVDKVKVFWSYGTKAPKNQTMKALQVGPTGDGKYQLNVTLPADYEGILWYQYLAGDPSNVWNFSAYVEVNVRDNDGPGVGPDWSSAIGEDRFDFSVNVTDNIGVDMVWVVYAFEGETPVNATMAPVTVDDGGNGTYGNVGLAIPIDRQVQLDYAIGAIDINGFVTKMFGQYENLDSEMPTFGANGSAGEPVKGHSIDVWIEAADNFGVNDVRINYGFGSATPKNDSMGIEGSNYTYTIHIPRQPAGDLVYSFHAVDVKGNWNRTIEWTVVPYNVAPVVGEMTPWEITEETNDVMDLQPFLSDVNDLVTSLTIDTEASFITVSGLRLTAYYDVWQTNHTIDVSVTDGENVTNFTVDITVINTNDLPIITSDPVKTAEVTVEYAYPVTYTDEDVGQTYVFTFDEAPMGMRVAGNGRITWTPVAGQEGSHNIDLALDDGYNVVHHQWTVTVAGRTTDEPPAFTNSPPLTHAAGDKYTFDFDAEDPDGDAILFKLVSGPEGAEMDQNTGVLTWSPKADQRDTSENVDFLVRVTDLRNDVDQEFTVALSYPDNEPPVITGSVPKVSTDRDTSINLGEYMSDPDDEKADLEWNATTDAKAFTVHMNGNHMVITVKDGKSGTSTVNLVLTDPWDESDSIEVTVEVKAVEDDGGALGGNMLYIAIAVVAVVVVIGLVYILKGGKKE